MAHPVEAQLELLSYSDSLFTNAHDLVSPQPVHDGRGTFTHLGVRMEGLESSRHWNLKHAVHGDQIEFWRDHSVVNRVEVAVRGPSNRMLVDSLEFNTAFYTKNPSKDIYEVVLIDELEGTATTVVKRLMLKGDATHVEKLAKPVAATRVVLKLGEGGLTRFKLFGTPLPSLPPHPSLLAGARTFGVSDASYGDPSLVLRPKREGNIMAGWESCRHSARHRLGIALAAQGVVRRLEIDTYMHCLNPFRFMCVLACNSSESDEKLLEALPPWSVTTPDKAPQLVADAQLNDFMDKHANMTCPGPVKYQLSVADYKGPWSVLLPTSPLTRDTLHEFASQLKDVGLVSHLLFLGVPDGGVHRIGVYGDRPKAS